MGKDYINDPETIAALKRLSKDHNGLLLPENVVAAARSASSPLHSYFTWDDTEAANKYRLEEARRLIRVTVEYIDDGKDRTPYRVFASLTPDRLEGGYRVMSTIMSDSEMRAQLLADAKEDMARFAMKYKSLKELAEVFQAMKKIK